MIHFFDLVNKFSLFDPEDKTYRDYALTALDVVLDNIPFIEVNTGALSRGYKNLYPASFLLSRIRERGGRLVLSSDAHRAEHLDGYFPDALDCLTSLGFQSLWQKGDKGWNEISIIKP